MGITEQPFTADVPTELSGERADKVVASLAGVSRSVARTMVEEGLATFDGASVSASARVAAGAVLMAMIPEPWVLEPEAVDFGVLFEDDDVVVIDKPPGIVVHPGAGHRRGTLAAGILHRWPQVEGVGEAQRWGIVHRLDRDTSGALVVAKTAAAYERISVALAQRQVFRRYVALAVGRFDIPTGTIDAPIARDPADPTRFMVAATGRPARTHYEVTTQYPTSALLDVTLDTGRTHQIRVHLASIGHPVAGDRAYGAGPEPQVPRTFLHAAEISFPATAGIVTVESPLPADLAAALPSS